MAEAETNTPSAPTGRPLSTKASKPSANLADASPSASDSKPDGKAKPTPEERAVRDTAFSTRWYWFTFLVSFISFWILLIYFQGVRQWYIAAPYWVAIILAGGLAVWSATGLIGRYQIVNKIGATARTRREKAASVDTEDQEVVYRENIVVRLFQYIGRLIALLFLFVWNTFLRLLYIAEYILISTLLLFYDILYWVTYAAWTLVYRAVRLALRIVRFALRVAWKILRILTRLPIARTLWDTKMMPAIMGRWNAKMAERREAQAKRRDTKRRLAAAKGLDPDKWEADQKRRHHFPLPHPNEAKKGLRGRLVERQKIDFNRRDRWTAYRKGLPIPPKIHSDRRKRKLEEKKKRLEEKRAKKNGPDKGGRKPRGERENPGDDDEKKAADEEIATAPAEKKQNAKESKRPKAQSAAED